MPKSDRSSLKPSSRPSSKSTTSSTDPRFSSLQTNPIFRLPSRKAQKLKLDDRFQSLLSSDKFTRKGRVDRYGRPLSSKAGRKDLERFYRLDEDDQLEKEGIDDDEEVMKELRRVEKEQPDEEVYDPARQGGFEESSSEEESSEEESEEEATIEEEADVRGEAKEVEEGEVTNRLAAVNLDWDNIRAADIMAVASSFCPADGKIVNVTVYPSEYGRERMEREQMEGPAKELFTSKKSQQVDRDLDSDDEDDEEDLEATKRRLQKEQAEEPEELDASSKALRQYQLTRLRYYYAVITTSSAATAHALYNQMDGREYLSTSNFFDLRFVPDETTFDDPITDKPRDTCTELPDKYRPNEFVTEALTHSKVRLTWDEEDRARGEAQKRAFAGAGADDDDLRAYVGSDSDSSGNQDEEETPAATAPQQQLSKQEIARRKTRALLGLPEDEPEIKPKKDEPPQGDMQITFSSGLGAAKYDGIFANKPEDVREETALEKYIRKERERKQRRKEKMRAAKRGDAPPPTDTAAAPDQKAETAAEETLIAGADEQSGEDPFDDPFFVDPGAANEAAKKQASKSRKKRDAELSIAQREQQAHEREDLRRLMNDDNAKTTRTNGDGAAAVDSHFDMAAIRRAEKAAAKKGSKKSRRAQKELEKKEKGVLDAEGERVDDFQPDLGDERFRGLFESTEYAIDPTNPRYCGTKAMKRILEEGRRKREGEGGEGDERREAKERKEGKRKGEREGAEIEGLVRKLKRRRGGEV